MICLFVLVMLLAVTGVAKGAPSDNSAGATREAKTATHQRACELYEQGLGQLGASPERAEHSFAESAALFRSLIESESGSPSVWDAGLLANAAHASLLSGDMGHAVLYYRRAAVLSPLDADVRRGLAQAHEKTGMKDASQPMLERIASYVEVVPRLTRGVATLAAWGLFWLAMALRVSRLGFKPPRWFVVACGAVVMLGVATFVPWELLRERSQEAVVIASVTPRQGPDEVNYPAARTEPFKPGTELRVIEKRGEWCCVTLNQSERAWVKAAAVAKVFEVE